MGPEPLVSIIIPVFNSQHFIAGTLDSVLSQSYGNLEIIVVDDGSTDDTSQIVRGYEPGVRYYYQENSGGCASPRNAGIKQSSGEFICFNDADDLMVPGRIARQVDFLKRHPQVGLVFSDYRNFDEYGPDPESHFQSCPRLWLQLRGRQEVLLEKACAYLAEENFGIAGTFMIRKALLAFEAGFEPTLRACEDFHFYYRLARHSPVGIINEVAMLRRLHRDNMSGNQVMMLLEGRRSRALLRDSERNPELREQLNGYIARCLAALARHYADQGEYLRALQKDSQAVCCHPCWSGLRSGCRNLARTLLLAAGARRPKSRTTGS